jgi:hypothetical protein
MIQAPGLMFAGNVKSLRKSIFSCSVGPIRMMIILIMIDLIYLALNIRVKMPSIADQGPML